MTFMGSLRRPARAAGSSRGALAIGLLSAVVVLGMIFVAIVSRESSDLHRRAEVVAGQVRAESQELSALKWRTHTDVLAGTADLSESGPLVVRGLAIAAQLNASARELGRLQPGADARRIATDVQQVLAAGLEALSDTRRTNRRSRAALSQIQDRFQPILDRMDRDAQLVAEHQQQVAATGLKRSLWASIGSLLLGVMLLGVLGWRLASLRRRAILAEEVRAVERRSERRIRALVEDSSDVVAVLDRDLRVRWLAASVRGLLGLEPESLLETPITSLAHPDDEALFEAFLTATSDGGAPATIRPRLRHADGHWLHVEVVAKQRFSDPAIAGILLNMRDVSNRIAIEEELRRQALHDVLTGLANRALFENRLRHALAARVRTHRPLAVLFIDLDDFKTINDSLGHRAGDHVLRHVAAQIEPLIRPSDTAARLGGDEFAVLLEGVSSQAEAQRIAARILTALSEGFVLDGRAVNVTASIGIASSYGSVQADELLRNADTAMYAAKASGKNAARSFQETMHHSALERFELRSELPRALEHNEFFLEYQPIVSLHDGRTVGVEALLRWQHPTRGRLGPDRFIGLAEDTGLIVTLGRWVLEQACAQLRAWHLVLRAPTPEYVSVNVSIRQLAWVGFPGDVGEILRRSELPPQALVLEITEGRLADDQERLLRQLRTLKELGVRVAVDDFGTGYSALSHLQQFPIDILKIDKSFIDHLDGDPRNANLVRGIINLGKSLHLDVIAEGVERPQQADRLRVMRSPLGQGILFSPPTSSGEILTSLLRAKAA